MVAMDRFRETYLNECAELLADMEARLVSYDPSVFNANELNAIFRCAHSVKGGAGAFGFDKVTAFTHKLETLLDVLRDGRMSATPAMINALLKSVDIVTSLLKSESQGEAVSEGFGAEIEAELAGFTTGIGAENNYAAVVSSTVSVAPTAAAQDYLVRFLPHENLFSTGNDPLLILRQLRALGEATVGADASRVPLLADYNPENCYLGWEVKLRTSVDEKAIREVFEFVEDHCDLTITKSEPAAAVVAKAKSDEPKAVTETGGAIGVTSIRVDLEKIDRLVNMVGELVITQAMLQSQSRSLPVDQFPGLIRGVDDLVHQMRELQEAVMSVRMQPIKSLFSRMPRVVRDIAQQLGKDIRLVTSGENTEVDKTIIEQLSDPLMHMIRNAADHGIEVPDVRRASGKPEQGTIELAASHQGGKIVIEVTEDGAGLNHEKILAKAREKELIAADAVMTPEAIEQLIFLPGFSTADKVSNISGRGVGMDVVKRNITDMGGAVRVKSELGKGTRFTITLPLTLAILDGMIVRVGAENYIIPITSIIETMRPTAHSVHAVPDGHDVLNVRGEFIPIVYLHELFFVPNAEHEPSKALVVLVESGLQKLGIVVDELVGQQQVVIKSLEANADPVNGISGATILGDGKVSLILDIAGLHRMLEWDGKPASPQLYKEAS